MRVCLAAVSISVLTACGSSWELKDTIPLDGCFVDRPYYLDADEDGWGDPEAPMRLQCTGDIATGYTARNKRDCDDGDPAVTGRIGSICPERMVVGGASYVGAVTARREYVAVLPPTDTLWAITARAACGGSGWGGDLATFDDATELAAVQAALEEGGTYAAFLGIASDGSAWGWTDGATLPISQIPPCSVLPDPARADDDLRLALVRPPEGEWCLGLPTEVSPPYGTAEPRYDGRHAHFVCARGVPDPSSWDEPAPAVQDTGTDR